jgi:1,4-dihydroxy-2-naphthoate octaprenyltransferase
LKGGAQRNPIHRLYDGRQENILLMKQAIAVIRLGRPQFLIGGFTMYALGAALANFQGVAIDLTAYVLGQLAVTSIHAMTHYLNDYHDLETDRLNTRRTFFSGGSGILPAGLLPPRVALYAGLSLLSIGFLFMLVLAVLYSISLAAWIVFAGTMVGAAFYSSPPLRLASTGFGEVTTALVVAFLVAALAYTIQAETLSLLVFTTTLPLIALAWAMVVAFEFPDHDADRSAGKRTVLVRLGARTTANLHTGVSLLAFILLAPAIATGTPSMAVALFLLAAIPALGTTAFIQLSVRGAAVRPIWMTLGAVTTFGLAGALMLAGVVWEGLR